MKVYERHKYNEICQQPCRVLLVEDDFDDQILGKKALESSKDVQEVLCFSNGYELVRYMEQQNISPDPTVLSKPTLIVIDLNMPKMDGFEILKRLKSETFFHTIPIVVVSGSASYENVKKALALKASAFFKKPLSNCDLHAFLRNGRTWPPKTHA